MPLVGRAEVEVDDAFNRITKGALDQRPGPAAPRRDGPAVRRNLGPLDAGELPAAVVLRPRPPAHAVAARLLARLASATPVLPDLDQIVMVDIDDTVRRTYG